MQTRFEASELMRLMRLSRTMVLVVVTAGGESRKAEEAEIGS